jgi:hypothetical protein
MGTMPSTAALFGRIHDMIASKHPDRDLQAGYYIMTRFKQYLVKRCAEPGFQSALSDYMIKQFPPREDLDYVCSLPLPQQPEGTAPMVLHPTMLAWAPGVHAHKQAPTTRYRSSTPVPLPPMHPHTNTNIASSTVLSISESRGGYTSFSI